MVRNLFFIGNPLSPREFHRLQYKESELALFALIIRGSNGNLRVIRFNVDFAPSVAAKRMQNLIILCQRCLTWIETHSEMCPDCGTDVYLDAPDISRELLAELLGKPLLVLGPLRVDRLGLPNYGYFIGTTAGVLFLPRLHRRMNGAWEAISSQRLPNWWPFQGDLASPRFINWLRKPFGMNVPTEQNSIDVLDRDHDSLADRLMDSPGAFFTHHRNIKAITGRSRQLKFERSMQRSIVIIDETTDGSLRSSLYSFLSRPNDEKLRRAL